MATVIGDFASDPSRFRHNMVFQPQPPQISHAHSHHHHHHHKQQQQSYRSSSKSWDTAPAPRQESAPVVNSPLMPTPSSSVSSASSSTPRSHYTTSAPTTQQPRPTSADCQHQKPPPPLDDDSGASRFPTPPDSSSPSTSNPAGVHPQKHVSNDLSRPHSIPDYMDTTADSVDAAVVTASPSDPPSTAASDATIVPPFSDKTAAPAATVDPADGSSSASSSSASSRPAHSIPSPASDGFPSRWVPTAAPASPKPTAQPQQTTVRIRDLSHIQSLARADLVTGGNNHGGILNVDPPLSQMKYDISEMPIGDVIEMVAALLTKITTTNDLQHDALSRNATHQRQAQAAQQQQQQQQDSTREGSSKGDGVITANSNSSGNGSSPYSNSVLAFHGKNVPAITILSYLSRIHKYCPTTFEVFLSLLVYFDRMTERVNDLVMRSEQERKEADVKKQSHDDVVMGNDEDCAAREAAHNDDEMDEDLADSDDEEVAPSKSKSHNGDASTLGSKEAPRESSAPSPAPPALSSTATYFVVDSYNIHRLIIAGVTCASKFFSDVFYTNSRYAKVGGLPLAELNHLELQFLLLNDFRLAVPVEDLEAYATMLVEFYARDVVAQRSRPSAE